MGAARSSLDTLLSAAEAPAHGGRQDRLVELLLGQIHSSVEGIPSPGERFARMFDAQALIPIDYLLEASDHAGKGTLSPKAVKNINAQLERLQESESLHGSISPEEKNLYGGIVLGSPSRSVGAQTRFGRAGKKS